MAVIRVKKTVTINGVEQKEGAILEVVNSFGRELIEKHGDSLEMLSENGFMASSVNKELAEKLAQEKAKEKQKGAASILEEVKKRTKKSTTVTTIEN